MKQYSRLSILVIFVLLMAQISFIQATEYSQGSIAQVTEYSQDTIRQGTVNVAEIGDVDGDGKDDRVVIYGGQSTLATGVSFSDGNSFNRVVYDTATWRGAIGGSLFIEDVDGDGNDDILFVLQEEQANLATVFISNGDGTFRDAVTQHLVADESLDYHIQGGDVNGDQRFDLILSAMINNGTETTTVVLRGYSDGSFQ